MLVKDILVSICDTTLFWRINKTKPFYYIKESQIFLPHWLKQISYAYTDERKTADDVDRALESNAEQFCVNGFIMEKDVLKILSS